MSESELPEFQHETMRFFLQAGVLRAGEEVIADVQRRADSKATDQNAEKVREEVAKLLKVAQSAQNAAQAEVQKAKLPALPDGKTPSVSGEIRIEAARGELEQKANFAQGQAAQLSATLSALRQHRLRQAARRTAMTIAGSVSCIVLLVVGAIAYRPLTIAWHYRQATAALEAEEWERARDEAEAVHKLDPKNSGAITVLRESYYQLVLVAIRDSKWEAAANGTVLLDRIQFNYRDIPDRIASNPELQSALTAKLGEEWQASTALQLLELPTNSGPIDRIIFNNDERLMVSGSADVTIRMWDLMTGKETQMFNGRSPAFSPNGQLLAFGSDKVVEILDVKTGQDVQKLIGHEGSVLCVAFSPDGRLLASGSDDNTVMIWDVSTGVVVKTLISHGDTVINIVFSPNGHQLASGFLNGTTKVWDVTTGEPFQTLKGWAITFSPDGQSLILNSFGVQVGIWNAITGQYAALPSFVSGSGLQDADFSPDGHLLALGTTSGVKMLTIANGEVVNELSQSLYRGPIRSVAFSSSGRLLATGNDFGVITMWRPTQP